MLNVVMLSIIMLNGAILSVAVLNVVASLCYQGVKVSVARVAFPDDYKVNFK
jgi:hypothetical protein